MKDLNLLYVFEALWRERSVTSAAESLGVTQAAVSSALKRLRASYGDKLFILIGRRMEPTAIAISVAPALLESLSLVRKATGVPLPFVPEQSHRTFTIRTRDIGEVVCLPGLYQAVHNVAPEVKLRTLFTPIEETVPALGNGRLDVAIGYLPALEQDIHRKKLLTQRYVCVMRKGHPFESRKLNAKALLAQDHLLVEYGGSGHLVLERALVDAGARDRIKVRLPQYMSAVHVLIESDLVWIAPEILAAKLSRHYPLAYQTEPLGLEPFEIGLYWHDRYHRDTANKWLRSMIVSLFADTGSTPATEDFHTLALPLG
ncbi:LysR family transcriptional regulator [Cupriavidus necator]|uniref:LysR family transcriptional regulator n=1 Tax=Cupriavidus necator TaxID=106590 RepID=UPI003F7338B2